MITWILGHFFWIFFIIVGFNVVRMIRRVTGALTDAVKKEAEKNPRRVGNFDPDEAERARRIREEILRKIAQRQGGAPVPQPLPLSRETLRPAPDVASASPLERRAGELTRRVQEQWKRRVPPLDPFGGGFSRPMARPTTPSLPVPEATILLPPSFATAATPPAVMAATAKEYFTRALSAPPRAPGLAPATYELQAARANVLADLNDVRSLRRAFVLREVLGTPVGLR